MLLAVVVGLVLRLLPKTPAAVRFAIWFAVFAVVTALPVASVWPRAGFSGSGRGAWLTLDMRWSLAIAAVWAVASLVRAGTLVVAAFRVRALWKRAVPVEVGGSLDGVELSQRGVSPGLKAADLWSASPRAEARCYSGGRRRAQLCISDEVDRPTVIGFFAPKIVIPNWLLEKLTPAELQQIVIHETGHLGRADDWMNLLQKIALVVFPLNPALAWVERRLCFERELAADERVLKAFAGKAGAAKEYAACLATVAEHRLQKRGLALALGALGRESELGRRVGRILKRGESMRPTHARLVLGGALLGLIVAAVGLERCPEVVGFASDTTLNRASITPLRAEDGLTRVGNSGSYHAVSLRVKVINNRYLQPNPKVPHEVMLRSSTGVSGLKATQVSVTPRVRDLVADERQPTLHDEAGKDGAPRFSAPPSPAFEHAGSEHMVHWVVVTSWRGEDGSRVVLTTADLPNGAGQPVAGGQTTPLAERAAPSRAAGQFEEFHPYAAVPVRGGWLVFQL
jgi:hypothetical protein